MKKLTAVFLAIVLFVSVLPYAAGAQEANSSYDESFENALNLVSKINTKFAVSDFSADDKITRGDFLRLALGLYDMNYTRVSHSFTDVPDDLSPLVSYAIECGMIDSGVKFYPDNPVNYDMAVRIAVIMTGYTPKALSGGYAYAAKYAKLLTDIEGSEMSAKNTVILLANVLNTKMMEQSVYGGDTSEYVISDRTFLETYHNIVFCEGIVQANVYTSLTSTNGAASDNHIIIGLEEFKCSEAEFLGYNVRAYYKKDTKQIVAMTKTDNTEITTKEISSVSGNNVNYLDDAGDEKRINLDASYQFIYNGKAYMHAGFEALFNFTQGSATFIDNNGDRAYDVVFVWDYNFMQVDYVDLYYGRVFDVNSDSYIDLSGDDCKYEVYYKYKYAMEKVELSDIAENATVTYCLSKDGKYCRFYITEENVTGKISEWNTSDKLVKIGDNFYQYNTYFETYYQNYFGKSATYNISYDGKLMSAGEAENSSFKYGWLSDVAPVNNGLNKAVYVRIYTEDGKLSDFQLAKKLTINGQKNITDQNAYTNTLEGYVQGSVYDRVIKFALNSDGEISLIDTGSVATKASDINSIKPSNDSLTRYYYGKFPYRSTPATFGKNFRVSASTVVFFVPSDEQARQSEKNFSIDSYSNYFTDNESYTVSAYDIDKTGLVRCLVYSSTDSAETSADLATSGVLTAVRTVYFPEEGEVKTVYDVYRGGGYRSYTAYTQTVEDIMKTASIGDVLRIAVNSNSEITGAILDYDLSQTKFVSTPKDKNRVEYFDGYLDGFDGTHMNVVANKLALSIDEVSMEDYYHINTARGHQVHVTVVKDSAGNIKDVQMNNIDSNSLLTFKNVGTNADLVVVRRRAYYPQLAVIYHFVTK